MHPGSEVLSRAAEAAGRQGKFWQMHDALYERAPPVSEETALELVRSPGWSRHVLDVGRALRERRRVVVEGLEEQAPTLALPHLQHGGMNMWVAVPPGIDEAALAEAARMHGVVVGAGRSFFATEPPSSHLRLSFGGAASHDELREALRRLGSALRSELAGAQ